jgi:ACS family D-galactonate transporter-like MFS transporter
MNSANDSNPYAAPELESAASRERSRPSTVRYRVMLWLTLAAVLSYLVRGAVSVAESTIRRDMQLSISHTSWFMGAFFWSYALFQVPAGWLAQRYGTRRMLALFAAAWSLAALLIGVANDFWTFVAAQLLMGIAQAGIFPAACNSIAKWMPLSRRSLSCAILATGMQMGAIGASLLTGSLLGPVGWRPLFMLYALPGLIWAIWFWLRFHDEP